MPYVSKPLASETVQLVFDAGEATSRVDPTVMGSSRKRTPEGFTLIELMVVVAIVAILAVVAYPSYTSYAVKANRAEAQAYLMRAAQQQQLFFNDTRSYAADEATLNITQPKRVEDNYNVVINANVGPPPTFNIAATPKTGSRQQGDGILTIDNSGARQRGTEPW